MRNIKGLVAIFAFSLLVSLPTVASAQWGGNNRNRDRDDDYYGRNNGYYNNYQLKSTVKRLKNDSKDLVRFIDRDLDRSRYDGRDREDRINELAKDFRNAANRLEDRFDSRNIDRSYREAQELLDLGNRLDRVIRRARLSYDVENYWNNIKRQLSEVSNAYNYNRGNRGRGNRNGDWRNRIPFPF